MKHIFIMGLSFDGRFREGIARLLDAGSLTLDSLQLLDKAGGLLEPCKYEQFRTSIGSADTVEVENLRFERMGARWRVRKLWDVDETVRRYETLAVRLSAQTLDLRNETARCKLWELWQDYWTGTIQSDPNWREYWLPEHFPLEPYNADKARRVCDRLAERFGTMPQVSGELIFWFMMIAEGLHPEPHHDS